MRRFLLYLLRWQLSSPILFAVLVLAVNLGPLMATVLSNLVGGVVFYWVDKWIFKNDYTCKSRR